MSLRLSRRSLFASGGAVALAAQAAGGPVWAQAANDDAGLAEAVDAYVTQAMEIGRAHV